MKYNNFRIIEIKCLFQLIHILKQCLYFHIVDAIDV